MKTMLNTKFWVTIKEHYGMLWYFLEWSIVACLPYLIIMFLFYFSKPLIGIHKSAKCDRLISILKIGDCKQLYYFL